MGEKLCRKESRRAQEGTSGGEALSLALMVAVHSCVLIPKLTASYRVNMDPLLHVTRTSIKWFRGKNKTQALTSDLSSVGGT